MNQITPYKFSEKSKKEQVEQMFDQISPKYDLLNRIISGGLDISWRKKVVALVQKETPKRIMDLATGTGDLAIALAKANPQCHITGVDLSAGMLDIGKEKISKASLESQIKMIQGDAELLPFEDNVFDVITVAFGVRNYENLEQGLREMHRVLKPQGKLFILELSTPESFPFKQIYHIYTKYILPFIGRIISKDQSAYTYLPVSVKAFPSGQRMIEILQSCGYHSNQLKPLTFGISTIYISSK